MLETIEALSQIPGVSGQETQVREEILRRIEGRCEARVDPLGNILVNKRGAHRARRQLMIAAHMDEVGFVITFIEESGLLRFSPVGGIDPRVMIGKGVLVGKDRIYGVIGTKAIHLQSDDEKKSVPKTDSLYIDIGARSREEAAQAVAQGDFAVFDSNFIRLGEDRIKCRALDDRAGCALLIELIRSELPFDCSFAFTVQEETGTTGARTAAYTLSPEIGIVVETTTASDLPGTPEDRTVCKLGGGPVISFADRGTLYDRELYAQALDTARKAGIPCQTKNVVAGGNDARSIQTACGGVRMTAVSMPCRYLHSPSCVLDCRDIEAALTLLRLLISRFAGQ